VIRKSIIEILVVLIISVVDNVGDKMRAGPHTPRPQPVPLRSPLCGLPTSFSGGIFSDSAILSPLQWWRWHRLNICSRSHKHFVESGDLQRHRLAKECLWMMTVGSSLAVLPFNVILGSSLQGLFDGTPQLDAMLWRVLDMLLSKKNPNALVLLSHVRSNGKIEMPDVNDKAIVWMRL
jgi:hypothetical protein